MVDDLREHKQCSPVVALEG